MNFKECYEKILTPKKKYSKEDKVAEEKFIRGGGLEFFTKLEK